MTVTKRKPLISAVKVSGLKERRREIDLAMRVLSESKHQPARARKTRVIISGDTVLVTNEAERQQARTARRIGQAEYIDQSVKDTERAVRTLRSTPSQKVKEFYEKLASKA